MDKGWVKLHRVILENHFLMRDLNAYAVFTKLLMMVGKTKGEWAGGRRQLADRLEMSPTTVYDTLKRLESRQMISIDANSRYSVISICNWHKYQGVPDHKKSSSPTTRRPEPDHTPATRRHSNKNKNKKENNILPSAKPPAKDDIIAKLYYEVVNAFNLPVMNHKHIWGKIELMKKEAPEDELIQYLTFMRDMYAGLVIEYKPHISKALDIYHKRVQIINILKQLRAEQQTSGGFRLKRAA